MKKESYILRSVINECKKHNARMNSAYLKIVSALPFTPVKIAELTDDEIEHIDQFIYRAPLKTIFLNK